MQSATLESGFRDMDRSVWHRALWLTVVTLTLGLCLVAWKRPATDDDVVLPMPAVAAAPAQQAEAQPVMTVVKVRRFRHLPVWASALTEVELMHEELPQPSVNRAA